MYLAPAKYAINFRSSLSLSTNPVTEIIYREKEQIMFLKNKLKYDFLDVLVLYVFFHYSFGIIGHIRQYYSEEHQEEILLMVGMLHTEEGKRNMSSQIWKILLALICHCSGDSKLFC